jgi:selenocysteine-specific elongation factor
LLVIALPHLNTLHDKTIRIVEAYHQNFPLRRGIPREELKSKLKLQPRLFNTLITQCVTRNTLTDSRGVVEKTGHEIRFDNGQQAKIETLKRKFEQNPLVRKS